MNGLGRGGGGRGRGGGRGGGFRRHGGGRGWGRRGGWVGYWGGWGPGYVDYYSYGPCDQCWGPKSYEQYMQCLSYYGCPIPPALGQEVSAVVSSAPRIAEVLVAGALVVGVGMWLNSRRK